MYFDVLPAVNGGDSSHAARAALACLGDWNHDAPEAEHWMQGVLAPDPSVLRLGAMFAADPV
ncbi:MAG TPA: hypothetical protein VE864_08590 [Streptosporangiaceae bacterium]|nr:hypothetical protein [Streptosporangiaceae bacterium]